MWASGLHSAVLKPTLEGFAVRGCCDGGGSKGKKDHTRQCALLLKRLQQKLSTAVACDDGGGSLDGMNAKKNRQDTPSPGLAILAQH